jgi:hypothetical protein
MRGVVEAKYVASIQCLGAEIYNGAITQANEFPSERGLVASA